MWCAALDWLHTMQGASCKQSPIKLALCASSSPAHRLATMILIQLQGQIEFYTPDLKYQDEDQG